MSQRLIEHNPPPFRGRRAVPHMPRTRGDATTRGTRRPQRLPGDRSGPTLRGRTFQMFAWPSLPQDDSTRRRRVRTNDKRTTPRAEGTRIGNRKEAGTAPRAYESPPLRKMVDFRIVRAAHLPPPDFAARKSKVTESRGRQWRSVT